MHARILLIDCDGLGAVDEMGASKLEGVEFYCLRRTEPKWVKDAIIDADLVFLASRMANDSRTSLLAEMGRVALEAGVLTVGLVSTDLGSKHSSAQEIDHISRLADDVDTLVVVPNGRLQKLDGHNFCLNDTTGNSDNLLLDALRCISDVMTIPGLIGVDFADYAFILRKQGKARMGLGLSSGKNRAETAAREAITSPLLENICIREATGVIINVTGAPDMGLHEVNDVCTLVEEAAGEDADIFFGAIVDPKIGESLRVTVLFCGLGEA